MQSHLQTSYYERVLGWVVWDLTICSRPFCWKEVLNACPCCLSGTRLLSTSVLSSSLSQATKKGVGLRGIYHFWRNHKIVCTFTGLKFCATHVWTVVPQSLKFYTRFFEGMVPRLIAASRAYVYTMRTRARAHHRSRRGLVLDVCFQLVYRLTLQEPSCMGITPHM